MTKKQWRENVKISKLERVELHVTRITKINVHSNLTYEIAFVILYYKRIHRIEIIIIPPIVEYIVFRVYQNINFIN